MASSTESAGLPPSWHVRERTGAAVSRTTKSENPGFGCQGFHRVFCLLSSGRADSTTAITEDVRSRAIHDANAQLGPNWDRARRGGAVDFGARLVAPRSLLGGSVGAEHALDHVDDAILRQNGG